MSIKTLLGQWRPPASGAVDAPPGHTASLLCPNGDEEEEEEREAHGAGLAY